MIELLFLAQNFQCGPDAPLASFRARYFNEQTETVEYLTVGQSVELNQLNINSVIIEPLSNADCLGGQWVQELTSANELPEIEGLYNQPAIQEYQDSLSNSESILLYELGDQETGDWQDVIIRIDWGNINNGTLYAD